MVHDVLQALLGRHVCRNVSLQVVVRLVGFADVISFVNKRLLLMEPDSLVLVDSILFVVLNFGVAEQVDFDVVLKVVVVHIDVVSGPHYQMDFLMRGVL